MLKDSLPSYQGPLPNDLNVAPDFEVTQIITFIDLNLEEFIPYYQKVKDSGKENRISDLLINHLQICKNEQNGFLPYDFRKNPTQVESDKETDIGVFVMDRARKPLPIIEFEAKRFSTTSKYKEYVSGVRGGIERFKRGHHSSHLLVCGMFGYVQSHTCSHWITKVNEFLTELSTSNIDTTIDWSNPSENLVSISNSTYVEKLSSKTLRNKPLKEMQLWHYFLDLTS
ncbi:hypothetical protein D0817_18985 [Flavobacterium cupreum]|uniref:Uncharacterized protein n=2 Tax=Flavobacterium TaxID=237 RepID=A0A434A3J5_9FLAO|nr:hypothetical protein [Flavobacterium cupreum]RUT68980.1 hypothetical protein D0817_18985 [Flavobacterium cupreum]